MTSFDLHVHTAASDGYFSPAEVVKKAKEMGLKAVAITDHDTTDGIDEALSAGEKLGLKVIPGIELSTDFQNKEIHILGYYMDYKNELFQDRLLKFRGDREIRAIKMVEKLNALGYQITFADVLNFANKGTVGRPHIAQALIAKGYLHSISEAFDKLLGRGKPGYAPREKLTPHQAVEFLKQFSGIPVMAHPGIAKMDVIIPELVKEGLMGLEVFHPEHGLQDEIKYQTIAKSHNLLITGGSDFHGTGQQIKCTLGVPQVEFSVINSLINAKESLENAIG